MGMKTIRCGATENVAETKHVVCRLGVDLGGDGERTGSLVQLVIEGAPHVLVKVTTLFTVLPVDVKTTGRLLRHGIGLLRNDPEVDYGAVALRVQFCVAAGRQDGHL